MRILVIEDGRGDARFLLRVLGKSSPAAYMHLVENAIELERYLATLPPPPDLILCDMLHPGNGDNAIDMLKVAYPETPIVVLTIAGKETQRRALAAGAVEVIEKPFDRRQFEILIEKLVERWSHEEDA